MSIDPDTGPDVPETPDDPDEQGEPGPEADPGPDTTMPVTEPLTMPH